jgi:phenol 2-monooxygenase (NADPH)
VRPDQYVANVLPLTATAELAAFFAQLQPGQQPERARPQAERPVAERSATAAGAQTVAPTLVSNGA